LIEVKKHPKKSHYEQLIARASSAIRSEFYLDASWYVYGLLEDRLVAALMASGGARDPQGNKIMMMGRKLRLLKSRAKNDPLLGAYFPDALFDDISRWKDARNRLMHDIGDARTPIPQLDKAGYLLATSGRELLKVVCRAVRLLKRNRHHIPVRP
jgi:hypothetical protein